MAANLFNNYISDHRNKQPQLRLTHRIKQALRHYGFRLPFRRIFSKHSHDRDGLVQANSQLAIACSLMGPNTGHRPDASIAVRDEHFDDESPHQHSQGACIRDVVALFPDICPRYLSEVAAPLDFEPARVVEKLLDDQDKGIVYTKKPLRSSLKRKRNNGGEPEVENPESEIFQAKQKYNSDRSPNSRKSQEAQCMWVCWIPRNLWSVCVRFWSWGFWHGR